MVDHKYKNLTAPTAGDDKDELVNGLTRKKIVRGVIIGHIIFIFLPLLVWFFSGLFKSSKPPVMQVQLVAPPPSGAAARPENTAKSDTAEKKTPTKVIPKKKPRKKALKPDQIKISKTVVKKTVASKSPPTIVKSEKVRHFIPLRGKVNSSYSARGNPNAKIQYAQVLGAFLKPLWNEPGKTELGGRRPEVMIRLNIAANGAVMGAQVIKRSGIEAMDNSVTMMLNSLRKVPTPPDGATTIDIILEIEKD